MTKRAYMVARNKAMATRGGLTHTYTGRSWNAMMTRCYNTNGDDYPAYGARGIYACAKIKASPAGLIETIGERPQGTSIDRIDGTGSYTCGACPECELLGKKLNVRWATSVEQTRNQVTNRMVTIDGVTKCLADWSISIGANESLIRNRLDRGITGRDLLLPPQIKRGIMVTIGSETRSIKEWADRSHLSLTTVYRRLARGLRGESLIKAA